MFTHAAVIVVAIVVVLALTTQGRSFRAFQDLFHGSRLRWPGSLVSVLAAAPSDASDPTALQHWQRALHRAVLGRVRVTMQGARQLPTSVTVMVNRAGLERLTADLAIVVAELTAQLADLANEYGARLVAPVLSPQLREDLADYEVVVSVDYLDETRRLVDEPPRDAEERRGRKRQEPVVLPRKASPTLGTADVLAAVDAEGRATVLREGRSYTFGRSSDNDIVVPRANKRTSRRHGSFSVVGGVVTLVSDGSYGTSMVRAGDPPVLAAGPVRVRAGDTLVLADSDRIRIVRSEADATSDGSGSGPAASTRMVRP